MLSRFSSRLGTVNIFYCTNFDLTRSTHRKPVKVRHGRSGQCIRFKIYANSAPGDNVAQSEVCGHIGGNGNHPCRKCLVGGPQKLKETDLGFHNLFQVSRIFFMFLPQLIDFSPVFLALPRVYTQM